MRLWRNVLKGCKFLVVRRDGTIPNWPHFVLGAKDPAAPVALRAYAHECRRLGMDSAYFKDVEELAKEFQLYQHTHGAGDPPAGPHRKDDPLVTEAMEEAKANQNRPSKVTRLIIQGLHSQEEKEKT